MPTIPDLTVIRTNLRDILRDLPPGITLKDVSIATQGHVQSTQLQIFRDRGALSADNLRLLEGALESLGLLPVSNPPSS